MSACAAAGGSTGNLPVPRGDQPRGREGRVEQFWTLLQKVPLPVPSAQWPDGTGWSPVLPKSISEFGLRSVAAGGKNSGRARR